MSNERPNTAEIRERLELVIKAIGVGNDAGASDDDAALATFVTTKEVLRWVLGEESRFDDLYQMITRLVRTTENIRQQNHEQN